jgi:hypothetical protein
MKKISIAWGCMLVAMTSAAPLLHAQATDKTLVSWVTLTNKAIRAGSVLTIQDGDRFDGIIFAERDAHKWMAGSNNFHRTQENRDGSTEETADDKTLVQMAIVYQGDRSKRRPGSAALIVSSPTGATVVGRPAASHSVISRSYSSLLALDPCGPR